MDTEQVEQNAILERWLPAILILMAISSALDRFMNPSGNIIIDYISIIISWGFITGCLEIFFSKGKNPGLAIVFAVMGIVRVTIESGIIPVIVTSLVAFIAISLIKRSFKPKATT